MCCRALDAQQSIMELTTTMRNFRPIEVNKRTEVIRVVLTTPPLRGFQLPQPLTSYDAPRTSDLTGDPARSCIGRSSGEHSAECPYDDQPTDVSVVRPVITLHLKVYDPQSL